ncbi:MAG: valine--tRNA ligase [Gemmataceae bacterium]|nr:valine--tRNA ligase [Gemmataceae bacterium]
MADALPKHYDPKAAQEKYLDRWDNEQVGHADVDPSKKPFTIVIPPPNVTGALHMGHALNNTLQDVLIRWRRMQGRSALYMPGTDHAGIATQAVVEKLIFSQEKKTRHDLGREKLIERIWEWKAKYEARILGQLKRLGCSCDWGRTRFTLDDVCSKAVRETFFKMFRDGYIYRGKRLVNWDTQLQTSVADDETYVEDTPGGFWTFKYPLADAPDTFIRFSTTRPETMLGDTAVCVHPSDARYKSLIGKKLRIPLNGREIPIIADGLLADPELGTGCVKVTPAHDPNDYACWTRNPHIGMINILNPDGTINAEGGEFAGLDRAAAREAVVAKMEALGFFEGREDRMIPLKYSDRSKSPIEPFLSDQWFVKMADRDDGKPGLAQMAMDAVTAGKVKITPDRYAKSYLDWLTEKRDWCISRQLYWGHRIPVWHFTLDLLHHARNGMHENESETRVHQEFREALAAFAKAAGIGDEIAVHCDEGAKAFVCAKTHRAESELEQFCKVNNNRVNTDQPPVYYADNDPRKAPSDLIWAIRHGDCIRDEDVLDTWFSSALWPHSTLGWPEKTPELEYFYPTNVLITSRDIITLWVARMVLTGLYNLGEVPFDDVYIHPKILDGFGESMSKSKGNGVDPLDIIDRYGTDALRFTMVHMTTETQDARLPVANVCPHCDVLVPVKQEHMYMRTKKLACPACKKPFRPGGPWPTDDPELPTAKQASEKFEPGRNFANKLWNASRFLLLNLEGYSPAAVDVAMLPVEDRWILSRLAAVTNEVTGHLEAFRFSEVARLIYDFTWSEFCDWYVEMSKGRLKDDAARPTAQRVLATVLDGIVRLVQPVMPFLAESIWEALATAAPVRGMPTPTAAGPSAVTAPWPTWPAEWIDNSTETRISRMQDLVRFVREVRNRYQVDLKAALDVSVKCSATVAAELQALEPFIRSLAGIGTCTFGPDAPKPAQKASHVAGDYEAFVSLVGLIDPAKEVDRLTKQIAEKTKFLAATKAKLSNESFVSRAPAELVAQQREQVAVLEAQIAALSANLEELR